MPAMAATVRYRPQGGRALMSLRSTRPQLAARGEVARRCRHAHEMTSGRSAARVTDRDADVAAREEPRAIGSALARRDIRGRVERRELDAREPFAEPATQ